MLKGKVTISLLMGPVVPVPVPKVIIDALTDVSVTSGAGQPSGFQLTFAFNNKSSLNTLLLLLAQTGPFIRVIIVANANGRQHVLSDGVISNNQMSPNTSTGQSILTVSGKDLTTVMDLICLTGIPYPAMPAAARVALIIAKYAMFGIIPIVIPSLFTDIPIPTNKIPIHQGTDLSYIKDLADKAGYIFYIDPGPVPGTNKAYWGPEIKIGIPQPALNVNMDGHSNVESLDFTYDGDVKSTPVVFIQNEQSKIPIPIPIPDIDILNPPLGLLKPRSFKFPCMGNSANLGVTEALSQGTAEAARTADVITGNGSLNVSRYGHILKSRSLVGVRGVGEAFNGLYYVKSVTHNIKAGEYKQSFTLTRNALVSITPRVPV